MVNQIIHGDCFEEIKKLPDNSVDLIITDPPYMMDSEGGGGCFGSKKRIYRKDMANAKLNDSYDMDIFKEFVRVLKKVNIYIFCNKNQIASIASWFKDYNVDLLVYHKQNPIPTVNNKYLSDLEYIFFIREEGVELFGGYHSKSKLFSSKITKREFDHPTIKPLALIKKFVQNSSKEGDVVFDPFLGSGTTALAAKMIKRKYIGMEINKDFYDIAIKRLQQQTL